MLNVTKTKTNLITNNVIQSGKSFKIYLEDQYGKSLSNQVIELKIGNVHHSLKTNNIGFACSIPFLKAMDAAILNAISFESTG